MKIIETTIRYYPALGGVEEYVKRLSEGLVLSGHQISVYTSDLEQHASKLVKLNSQSGNLNGVKVIRNYTLPIKLRDYSVMPGMPLKILSEKFDLIHGHCFMTFPMDVGNICSIIKNKPFVFNPYFTQFCKSSVLGNIYKKTLGALAMKAKAVIVISDFEKKLIEEAGYHVGRFETVAPGINIEEFNSVNQNIYEKFNLQNKKIILFVGRLDYNKGIDVLIKSAKILVKKYPDVAFFIAGKDFGELSNLKKMTAEYGLDSFFTFSGALSRPDLISAFKNAHIFAFPSRYEAFGITLIEAMAAKLAVVASDSSAIPYVIKDNQNGLLFKQNNSEELADKLFYLLNNETNAKALSLRGYESTLNEYSWDKAVNKINNIYRSLQ